MTQSGFSSVAAVNQVASISSDSGVAKSDIVMKSISKRRLLLQKHRTEIPTNDSSRAQVNSYLQLKADENLLLFWKTA